MIASRSDNSPRTPDSVGGEHADAQTRERHGLEGDRDQYDTGADPAAQVPLPSDSEAGAADPAATPRTPPTVVDAKQRILDWGVKPMVDKESMKAKVAQAVPPALLVGGAVVAGLLVAGMLRRKRSVLGSVVSAAIKPTLLAAFAPIAIDLVHKIRSEIKRAQRGPDDPVPGTPPPADSGHQRSQPV